MAQTFIVSEIAMDGSEKTHAVNSATRSMSLHAVAGSVGILDETGASDEFTLTAGGYMSIDHSAIRGTTMIFKGTAPAIIQILEQTGVLS